MNKRKIESNFSDERGQIADVFYKHPIDHVAVIDSNPGVLRGNHYHKRTTQHVLVTRGTLEYWHKPVGFAGPAQCELVHEYELVSTPPMEIHALRVTRDGPNQFIVFSEGTRGGPDYEQDTYRVEESLIPHS
jgi:hypothetical protein